MGTVIPIYPLLTASGCFMWILPRLVCKNYCSLKSLQNKLTWVFLDGDLVMQYAKPSILVFILSLGTCLSHQSASATFCNCMSSGHLQNSLVGFFRWVDIPWKWTDILNRKQAIFSWLIFLHVKDLLAFVMLKSKETNRNYLPLFSEYLTISQHLCQLWCAYRLRDPLERWAPAGDRGHIWEQAVGGSGWALSQLLPQTELWLSLLLSSNTPHHCSLLLKK